ncbi:MAG: DUF4118 domain-containing protein [Rhodocyclaceae bacterium]|nr:DUF4118 domain-containing protein [Rhodocyclaceae bacterium]
MVISDYSHPNWRSYCLTLGLCGLTAVIASPLRNWLDQANTVMLFNLVVVAAAVYLGRGPAILAAFAGVALFDFFFVPPHFTFAVANLQYLVTFAVMLAVGLVISHLAAGLRQEARDARVRESQLKDLYELARCLAGIDSESALVAAVCRFASRHLHARAALFSMDSSNQLQAASGNDLPTTVVDSALARSALASGRPLVPVDDLSGDPPHAFLPLTPGNGPSGVLVLAFTDRPSRELEHLEAYLTALASLVETALQRLRLVEHSHESSLQASAERLRASILSALSHDVRTPLTALYGLADSLALFQPPLPAPARELAAALRNQALRLSRMVDKLLDIARFQSGRLTLRREWQPVEEVIGASLQFLEPALEGHPVDVRLEPGLPLLELDAVLMERVFGNILENAAKYSPPGSPINIEVTRTDGSLTVKVNDQGPGFPPEPEASRLFDLFQRGETEGARPGMGLGLAICRTILEAHGGTISVSTRPEGGGCVTFSLPLGEPPLVEAEPGLMP